MAKYKSTAKLSESEAAYLAGLIDADGTITLCRKHKNENRQLAVSISNTDRQLLEFVRNSVSSGNITSKRTTKSNHTPSYTYAVYNRQAFSLLEQITKYLKTYKLKRARLILDKYQEVTPRNGKYTPEMKENRERFISTFLETKPGSTISSSKL